MTGLELIGLVSVTDDVAEEPHSLALHGGHLIEGLGLHLCHPAPVCPIQLNRRFPLITPPRFDRRSISPWPFETVALHVRFNASAQTPLLIGAFVLI